MENTINEQRKEQLDNGIMLNQKFANLNSKAKFIKSKINQIAPALKTRGYENSAYDNYVELKEYYDNIECYEDVDDH